MPDRKKPLVLLLAARETSPSMVYGLYDLLYSVGAVYPDMTTGEPGEEALDVRIVAADDAPFRCLGGAMMEPHGGVSDFDRADIVVVCDFYTPVHARPAGKYLTEIEWLRRMHAEGALVCSVCSGGVLLAETGLLDGRGATVHWAYRDLFRRHYPKVRLRNELVLCLTEEADGLLTAGGGTSWQDLAIYLVGRLCGRSQAVQTAKLFLVSGHDEGQLPYAVLSRQEPGADAVIAACQSWIALNYGRRNPVEQMAERSGLAMRTFARRFRAASGYAPIEYVQALRVEEAKQMLETDDTGIDEIAAAVGYEDPASFRRVFRRLAGLTPAAYRRKFRAIAPGARPSPGVVAARPQ